MVFMNVKNIPADKLINYSRFSFLYSYSTNDPVKLILFEEYIKRKIANKNSVNSNE